MSMPPKSEIVITDFPGLVTNIDPKDIPPGAAQIMTNVAVIRQAQMQARQGYREVTFEN